MWILMRILVGHARDDVPRSARSRMRSRSRLRRSVGRGEFVADTARNRSRRTSSASSRRSTSRFGQTGSRSTRTHTSTVSGASAWPAPCRSTSMRSTTRCGAASKPASPTRWRLIRRCASAVRGAGGGHGLDQRVWRRGRLQLPPSRYPQLHRDGRELARREGLLRRRTRLRTASRSTRRRRSYTIKLIRHRRYRATGR